MKLKRIAKRVYFLLFLLCAVVCATDLSACGADAKSYHTITDVYAADVSVVYDGKAHTVSVMNTLPTDSILYSKDDVEFGETIPLFTMPGTYTVYFKVSRTGYTLFKSSATVTIAPCTLSGISAQNVCFTFDGQPHTIAVDGTLASDTIFYSTNGVDFSTQPPEFTDVGEYTVYYRVEREYGDYRSSCILTILPNIFGRYFNKEYGLIVLSQDGAAVNSKAMQFKLYVDGTGVIGDKPFSVADGKLTYDSHAFTPLSDSDYVYMLTANDSFVYFCAGATGTLDITFDDDGAAISLGENTLASVKNVNYCENALLTDYVNLVFELQFENSEGVNSVTEVNLTFSARQSNPLTVDAVYIKYDGGEHGFDVDGATFIDEKGKEVDSPTFTQVGRHTARAVVVSDEYLPLIIDCVMVIMPNIDGVYFASTGVVEIKNDIITIDGKRGGALEIQDDEWTYNGLPIKPTDSGIEYDGTAYASTNANVIVVNVNGAKRVCLEVEYYVQIFITVSGGKLVFTANGDALAEMEVGTIASIKLGADELTPIITQTGATYVIGESDMTERVITIEITTAE